MKTKISLLLLSVVLLMQSCIVSQRPNIDFMDDPAVARNANIVSVNVPMFMAKPFIKKALREDGESEALIRLVKKIKRVRVMTVSGQQPAVMRMYGRYLDRNRFDDWLTVNHEGQKVRICSRGNERMINKLMLSVQSDSELVFIDISGKFTTDDISYAISKAQDN